MIGTSALSQGNPTPRNMSRRTIQNPPVAKIAANAATPQMATPAARSSGLTRPLRTPIAATTTKAAAAMRASGMAQPLG